MELKSMKMTDAETQEYSSAAAVEPPRYPWGLCIELDNDALDKLGIPALPAVGETMKIEARVLVSAVSMNDRADGEKQRRVSLQITEMGIGPDKKETDAAKSLYGA